MKKLLLISLILGIAACEPLKDGYGLDNPEQYSRIYLAAAYNGVQELNLEAPEPAQVKIFANYSGVVSLGESVSVTLGADISQVSEYNQRNGTHFQPMAQACYSFEKDCSLIPAGHTTATEPAVLDIITQAFADEATYLLPVRILSVSQPSLAVNSALETLYIAVTCSAGILYITSNPLTDYTLSDIENW